MVADNKLPQSLFFMKFLNNLTKGRCYVHFTLEGCADYGGWIATQKKQLQYTKHQDCNEGVRMIQ